jgi:alpha-tubulin suppressor-like RCC1 family protein
MVLAVAIGSCLCASTGTAFARRTKPVISEFRVAPATVASEATVSVIGYAYDEAGAAECTVSSKPAVAGLPAKVPCQVAGEEGYESFDFPLEMPANFGKKAVKYKFELIASGPGGKAKAKATVTVTPATPRTATDLTAGGVHTCALLSTAHVACWGENEYGQLGRGDHGDADTPVETRDITDATEVGAGAWHTCAVVSSGHVDCWGDNQYGELGNGTTTNSEPPVEALAVTHATQVTGGDYHTCAVVSSGHVDCWGNNEFGQLGDGTNEGPELCGKRACSSVPIEPRGITDATEVTAGENHTCALLSTGHIECWGDNEDGELGDGTTTISEPTPVAVKGITDATQVAASGEHTCALLSTGHVDCWGDNEYGDLGDGASTGPETCGFSDVPCSTTPVAVTDITDATYLAPGLVHTCAVLSTGHVDCWGSNGFGELGNGTTTSSDTPVEAADIKDATLATASSDYTCALLSTGHVDCWGNNQYGELGDGTANTESPYGSDTPVEVVGI